MKTFNLFTSSMIVFILYSPLSMYSQHDHAVPIKTLRDKTMVTIKIGDKTISDILLDTGFDFDGIIIYNPDYRDSLDLSSAALVSLGGAGDKNAQQALMIDSAHLMVGNRQLTNLRIIVLQSDIYKGFPSNGIIGYAFFGHYAVEIDYDRGELILHDYDTFKPDPTFTRVPLYFKDNRIPWMDAAVVINDEEPVTVSAYIDFADRDPVVLLERPEMKFNLPEATEKKVIGRGLSGDVYGRTGKISKLIIGSFQLNDVNASIAPAEVRSKQKDADVVIGCGALNRFNLIFDYKNECLYLKPNQSFDKQSAEF